MITTNGFVYQLFRVVQRKVKTQVSEWVSSNGPWEPWTLWETVFWIGVLRTCGGVISRFFGLRFTAKIKIWALKLESELVLLLVGIGKLYHLALKRRSKIGQNHFGGILVTTSQILPSLHAKMSTFANMCSLRIWLAL